MRTLILPLIASAALAACSGGSNANDLAAIDNSIANQTDPALTSALEDQILVDPNLVAQSGQVNARPPATPVQAQYPVTDTGTNVRRASATTATGAGASLHAQATGGCGAELSYGPEWARRLPADFPAYPGGRVTEAAGIDNATCRMRVVTFRTSDLHARVVEHYRGLATRAGYTAELQRRGADFMLGGVNRGVDGAFVVIVTPQEGGSEVALVVNRGG